MSTHVSGSPAPTSSANPSWLDRLESGLQHYSGSLALCLIFTGFVWRLWLAHATFFNTDEAWHYWLGNCDSLWMAYKASLTINHPPLLILVLHFWRHLGTSNLVLRLPSVFAGTAFCWFFYRWLLLLAGRATAGAGLILVAFLPPMISMSADLRQYPPLLLFSAAAAYFLELALDKDSGRWMILSSVCLCLAMLSHYGTFFVAAALGVYAILRFVAHKPPTSLLAAWMGGEIAGVILAGVLFKTHIARLSSLVRQSILPQLYLSDWYFHKGKDHLLPFLYRGTFGVFRFAVGQTQIGQFAAVLFLAVVGVLLLATKSGDRAKNRAVGVLLLLPFVLNWIAVAAGVYPYGRMRQCVFLAIFGLAGVSVCLSWIARRKLVPAVALAVAVVVLCQAFGTQQDRDALPLTELRHEHMDQAVEFMRSQIAQGDIIFTDQATSFQLRHYLCGQKPVAVHAYPAGFETFGCEGFTVIITGVGDGALTAEGVAERWRNNFFERQPGIRMWVAQGGWATGLGEALRTLHGFGQIDVHSFGRYFEVFQLPHAVAPTAQR